MADKKPKPEEESTDVCEAAEIEIQAQLILNLVKKGEVNEARKRLEELEAQFPGRSWVIIARMGFEREIAKLNLNIAIKKMRDAVTIAELDDAILDAGKIHLSFHTLTRRKQILSKN